MFSSVYCLFVLLLFIFFAGTRNGEHKMNVDDKLHVDVARHCKHYIRFRSCCLRHLN